MHSRWFVIPLIYIGWLFAAIVRADIVVDSAAFDRAYIPALALTSQGNREKSKVAMERLKVTWKSFEKAHSQDYPADAAWATAFIKVPKLIAEADAIVSSNGNLGNAHNMLEHVRVILMEQRQKQGIEYFLDYQTAFHEPMEEIVLVAKGKTPATFTEIDLAKIKRTLPELEDRWKAVRSAKFVAEKYGFDSERSRKMARFVNKETEAIGLLKNALASADTALIIQRAVALKPPFAQLFMLFGDFSQ